MDRVPETVSVAIKTSRSGTLSSMTRDLAAATLWRMPSRFGLARVLGPRYSLRCVLFHDVSDAESSFTRGLGVTVTRSKFEATLKFLTTHYHPVDLQDILAHSNGRKLPPRSVLVTFDDAYASIAEFAAPLCRKYGVPAVFFVNAACLDNGQLALDNLVCYVANVLGLRGINAAAGLIPGIDAPELHSLAEVFTRFLPSIPLTAREVFRDALIGLTGIRERDLASKAGLYLTSQQLKDLAGFNFEIGNHTYTHVHCRALEGEAFHQEIDKNKADLEACSGRRLRSFSVPYGSAADLSKELVRHLRLSGHEAVFLSESVANHRVSDLFYLDRVSIHANSEQAMFFDIEVMPRLRAIRNRLFRPAPAWQSRSAWA